MQCNSLTEALANIDPCDKLYLDLGQGDAIPADVGKLTKVVNIYGTGKRDVPYRIPPEATTPAAGEPRS